MFQSFSQQRFPWVSFHATAQIAINPGLSQVIKEILYLPILLALGIGMSVNNGKAVLEALLVMILNFKELQNMELKRIRRKPNQIIGH